jgi:hypothetical protein
MNKIAKLTDTELLKKAENGTLDTNLLTHKTQMRICWVFINAYGLKKAIEKNNEFVDFYYENESSEFNQTLSRAYTEIIHDFMKKSPSNDFYKMLKEFPRLKHDFKKIIKTHYGYNVLKEGFKKEEPKKVKVPMLFTF